MVMVLSNVVLPNGVLSAGVSGKQVRKNERVSLASGAMKTNVVWQSTLRRYDLSTVPLSVANWQTIEGLHETTHGGAYGFLMLDPKDCSTAATAGVLVPVMAGELLGEPGFGYGVPTYQLHKRIATAGSTRTYDRRITRPKSPISMLRALSPVTIGGGAGNAAIDYDTGRITFAADATSAVSSVTAGASTSVTLASALSGLAIGGRLWLEGLTGADSAILNGLSHPITNIAGAIYTLGTNTTGKTITATGTGKKYPQPTEALNWSGMFYVPVQFESDEIDWDLVVAGHADSRMLAGSSVALVEVRE